MYCVYVCGYIAQRMKIKESEKKDKYLDLARELKPLRNMKVAVISVVIDMLGTITKGTGRFRNKRISRDYPDYSIKISQNTEKSPGNLLSLKLSERPSVNAGVKNSHNNDNKITITIVN